VPEDNEVPLVAVDLGLRGRERASGMRHQRSQQTAEPQVATIVEQVVGDGGDLLVA